MTIQHRYITVDDVRLYVAEDCGHFVHYGNPDRAASEIASFFGDDCIKSRDHRRV